MTDLVTQFEESLTALLRTLPCGPEAIPWYADFIMPQEVPYSELIAASKKSVFPCISEILYPALIIAAIFGVLRTVFTKFFFKVRSTTCAQGSAPSLLL